ncbi:MAG: flagellar basal body rod protein FlgC [Caulobacterales bacterium]
MDALKISLSGLDVEWRRLEIIANNLANMNSTRTENGEPFHPMRLVSGPAQSFGATLAASGARHDAAGAQVTGVEQTPDGLRRVYEPNHPHADAEGFVTYPNVDHAGEMALMIKTSRAYEANLAAFQIAQDMYGRALDMGRQS